MSARQSVGMPRLEERSACCCWWRIATQFALIDYERENSQENFTKITNKRDAYIYTHMHTDGCGYILYVLKVCIHVSYIA